MDSHIAHISSMDSQAHQIASTSPSSSQDLNGNSGDLQDDLSSGTDDKRLARQKRKRTSPDDQAILEAAYKRDTKPDKAARLQLVEQVALGEKEVQIWFQNRRQSCRRKSGKPLLPHEIAQYQMAKSVNGPVSAHELDGQVNSQCSNQSMASCNRDCHEEQNSTRSTPEEGTRLYIAATPSHSIGPLPVKPASMAEPDLSFAARPALYKAVSSSLSTAATSHVGYLANRRSAPSLHRSLSETAMRPPPSASGSLDRPQTKPSAIRLSMDAEGNAVVTTKDTSSPSPPRPSQSVLLPQPSTDLGVVSLFPPSNNTSRNSSGRSRDSRSWEFWCDKDARAELEDVAEKDSHGSATGAIGLLRTSSGRSVLTPLSVKRNAPLGHHEDSAKRFKRRSLQRSHTSLGRLQGGEGEAHLTPKLKATGSATTNFRSSGDSDKENWSPEDQSHSNNASRRRVIDNQSSRLGANDPDADPELSGFMCQGRKRNIPAGEQELDCVQGLLSLSQGNWVR